MDMTDISLELTAGLLSPPTPACVYRDMLTSKQWKTIKTMNKISILECKGLTKQKLLDFLVENQVKQAKKHHSKQQLTKMAIILVRSVIRNNNTAATSKVQPSNTPTGRASVSTRSHVSGGCKSLLTTEGDACSCVVDLEECLREIKICEQCPALLEPLQQRRVNWCDDVTAYLLLHGQQINSSCRRDLIVQLRQFLLQRSNSFAADASLHNITQRKKKKPQKKPPAVQTSPVLFQTTVKTVPQSAPPKITINNTVSINIETGLTLDFADLSPAVTSTPALPLSNKSQKSSVKCQIPPDLPVHVNNSETSKVANKTDGNSTDVAGIDKVATETNEKKFSINCSKNSKQCKDATFVLAGGPIVVDKLQETACEGYKKPTVSWMMKIKEKKSKTETSKSGSCKASKNWCTCHTLNNCKFIACKHFLQCNICSNCHTCHKKIITTN